MITDTPPRNANHHTGFLESDPNQNPRPAARRAFADRRTIRGIGNEGWD